MLNRAELKADAKQKIKGKLLMVFLITLVYSVASCIITAIPFVGPAAMLLIYGPITLAWTFIYLAITRENKKPQVGDLFKGFHYFESSFIAAITVTIFTWLWSLLFIIPGIIKAISYSQTFYILAGNPTMSGNEARKQSMALMAGHKTEYFVLCLSFIGWGLLIPITFGIAGIWVIPYMQTTLANYYRTISGEGLGGVTPVGAAAQAAPQVVVRPVATAAAAPAAPATPTATTADTTEQPEQPAAPQA